MSEEKNKKETTKTETKPSDVKPTETKAETKKAEKPSKSAKNKGGKEERFSGVCGACKKNIKDAKIDPKDGVRCPDCNSRVGV
jgi:DNA-directed RNA polymerase subunit RPC12/RpoP